MRVKGRWKTNSLALELWRDGRQIANVAPACGRYYYEVFLPDTPMRVGWANSRYEAQRAARKAIREMEVNDAR